jgi:2-phospho-L-lactate guanylyltransferase
LIIAIIPVKKFENSKSRLSAILGPQERIHLARLMLEDTLTALARCRSLAEIAVVTADGEAREIAKRCGATILSQPQDAGVNMAVAFADRYAVEKKHASASIVIPQDLPLLCSGDIDTICSAALGTCVVICPSIRYDGTNILLRMPPHVISTSYDNNSYDSHISSARAHGVQVHVIKHDHLMFDVDTVDDARRLVRMDPKDISSKNVAAFLKKKLRLSS